MAEPLARLPRAARTQRGLVAVLITLGALVAVPASTVASEPRTLDLPPVGEEVRAIAAGGNPLAYCAIRPDRSLVCWLRPFYVEDENEDGTSTKYLDDIDREYLALYRPPAGEFLAVSVGGDHACAIGANQELKCWGADYGGNTKPPTGEFSAIAAGWSSSCAIRADQTVACWGSGPGAQPPAGTFTTISAGQDIYCGMRTDKTAACWGGSVDTPFDTAPEPPPEEFSDVAVVQWFRACGIRPDTTVACWGGPDPREQAWMDKLATEWLGQALAIGDECAIRIDRSLVCFGAIDPDSGEAPEEHPGTFTAVAGQCAIRTDGTLFCADFDPSVGPRPPATDMAAPHPLSQSSWIDVLLGLCAALGAGAMLLRMARPAGSVGSPRT